MNIAAATHFKNERSRFLLELDAIEPELSSPDLPVRERYIRAAQFIVPLSRLYAGGYAWTPEVRIGLFDEPKPLLGLSLGFRPAGLPDGRDTGTEPFRYYTMFEGEYVDVSQLIANWFHAEAQGLGREVIREERVCLVHMEPNPHREPTMVQNLAQLALLEESIQAYIEHQADVIEHK